MQKYYFGCCVLLLIAAENTFGMGKNEIPKYPSELTSEERLCLAISKGALTIVKKILEDKPFLARKQINKNFTPLHLAIDYKQLNIIKYLLTLPKVDINALDSFSRSPFHIAGSRGDAEIINLLCSYKKIDANIITEAKSPLAYTIKFGTLDAIKTLSECSGVNIFFCDWDESNALHVAAESNRADVIEFFSKKLSLNSKNYLGYSPLHIAASFGNNDALKKLIALGACCNDTSGSTESPLCLCVQKKLVATMAILVNSGALMSEDLWKKARKKDCFSDIVKTLLMNKFVKKDLEKKDYLSIYKGMYAAIKNKQKTSLENVCRKYVQQISQDYGEDIVLTKKEQELNKQYFNQLTNK